MPVWCSDWWSMVIHHIEEFSVFAIKSSSKALDWLSSNHDTVSLPLLDHFHSLSRQFAFVRIIYWHPSHRIPVLCFHLLVFPDIQAAVCSATALSVNIHTNMHNMQNISDTVFLLFMQDNSDICHSYNLWDTNFHACQRPICQYAKSRTECLEGWICSVYTIICKICKLCNKCNLYQICAGTSEPRWDPWPCTMQLY